MRCSNLDRPIRLQGIDAPEMPGACRPGRNCTPGDPFAARDHLRSLTRGRDVRCEPESRDSYDRIIARCTADGVDLSCAMIASGHAVPRYVAIDCPATVAAAPPERPAAPSANAPSQPPIMAPPDLPARAMAAPDTGGSSMIARLLLAFLWLAIVNGALFLYALRHWPAREATWERPRPLSTGIFLALAGLGGSPAALASIWLRDPGDQQDGLEQPLTIILGLHLGMVLGGLVLLLW